MKAKLAGILFLLALAGIFVSCSKIVADEDITGGDDGSKNSTVSVKAVSRTTDDGEATVSYPVHVYVFNSSDKCVGYSVISSADDLLTFSLSAGEYDVYAIGGANEDDYNLPSQATATKETAITLKDGKSHGDLMTAHYSLSLNQDENNEISLALERKVLMLQNIVMASVPSSVEEVSVSLSSFHNGILLNGTHDDTTTSVTVSLAKDDTSGEWKNASPVYILASYGAPTITISMKKSDSTTLTSYTYNFASSFDANHKYDIMGTYDGGKATVNGTIQGSTWGETKTMTFTYGEGASDSETLTGDCPEVGTAYKGAYVLSVDKSSSPAVVTLMSFADCNTWTATAGNTEEMTVDIDNNLAKIGSSEISGWRLPTKDEIGLACENQATIRENFATIKGNDSSISVSDFYASSTEHYLFADSDGTLMSYTWQQSGAYDTTVTNISGNTLRAFATVEIAN